MFPIHFPKTLTIVLAFLFIFNAPAYAVDVGKTVVGKEYNDILGMWVDRRLGLQVAASNDIFFVADTGLGEARTRFPYYDSFYSKPLKESLEFSVLKAIKWSKVAKKNRADVHKFISCFGENARSCWAHEGITGSNQLLFEFTSQKGGKQTNLIITIKDRGNEYKEATLYLGLPEMIKLLGNIRKIDQGIKEAKAMEEKQNLFN